MFTFITALAALTAVSAAPIEERQNAPFQVLTTAPWDAGAVTEWQIHGSCNGSQAHQIRQGLDEAVVLASHAKDHINRWGNSSTIYRKFFGNAPTPEAIGALDIIVNGDRAHALFRCDNPDGQCTHEPTWGGHYRGSNATEETVICPLSFFQRRPLATICSMGWNVREYSRLLFWSSDLMHRLYHVPAFGQHYIDHYAEGYEGIIEAAANNSPNTTRDSDGLQYFALEAYAYDVIAPGVGCPGPSGPPNPETSSAAAPASTSSASSASETASASATATETATATAVSAQATPTDTDDLPENCHTHDNGEVHCT